MQIERRGKPWQRFNPAVVGSENDVLNLQSSGSGGASGFDVSDDDAPVLSEVQAFGECGRDFLRDRANLYAMHVTVLAQAVIDEIHDAGGNRESQAFTAAAGGEDESVDSDYRSIHIDERSTAVSGIDGRVGLNVGEGLLGVRLAGDRAYDSHGDRILQAFWTADG